MSQRSQARPQLPTPTADPVPGQAGQFYLSIRQDLVRDVRRVVRQELRSGRRPSRKRRRGGRKERRVYWGREQLRRLRQSVGDQVCHSSISALVAIWHDAAVFSSAQIQVVCANRQRQRMISSLRAWRRWAPIVRCAAVYRYNMASSPQLYPDPLARPFVPVRPAAGDLMAQVLRGLPVRSLVFHLVMLWRLRCSDLQSLLQVFSERQQRLHRLSCIRRWLQFARHRVALCRVLFKHSLRRAWVWWSCSLWDADGSEEGNPCSELMGCGLAIVKQHMEYQQLQEFQQSLRDRNGANVCVVCFLPGSKRCSQCKSVWYCSRSCQSAHWPEHKGGGCFKLDLHVLSLLDVCSPQDLQYLKCSEDY
jgi:hypothetical protein